MKFRFKFSLPICCLLLLSCTKDEYYDFKTEVTAVSDLTYESATIEVLFDTDTYNNYVSGEVYWGEHPSPDETQNVIEVNNIRGEDYKTFDLDDLHGNTTYFVKSFFSGPADNLGDGNVQFETSQVFSFTTPQVPDAPCTTVDGEMKLAAFSSTVWDMSDLTGTDNGSYYTLESTFTLGDVEFRFKEEPNSGIYHTSSSTFTSLGDFEVSVYAYIQETWTCVYSTTAYNEIHVLNDGNGGIEISFCDLSLGTTGGCSPSHTLTGKVSN